MSDRKQRRRLNGARRIGSVRDGAYKKLTLFWSDLKHGSFKTVGPSQARVAAAVSSEAGSQPPKEDCKRGVNDDDAQLEGSTSMCWALSGPCRQVGFVADP